MNALNITSWSQDKDIQLLIKLKLGKYRLRLDLSLV